MSDQLQMMSMFGMGPATSAAAENPEAYAALQGDRTRQLIAQMLLARGMQQPQGQMVGRFYVPASPLQHVGNLAQAGLGVAGMNMADQKRMEMAKQIQDRQKAEVEQFQQAIAPKQVNVPMAQMGDRFPVSKSDMPDTWDINELQGGPTVGMQTYPNEPRAHMAVARPIRERYGMEETTQTMPTSVPRGTEEIKQAIMKAMTSTNPWLREAVKFMAQQQQVAEQKESQREFLSALAGFKADKQEDLARIKGEEDRQTKGVVSGDARLAQTGQDRRTDLGKIQQIDALLEGLEPNSPEAKALMDLRTKLSTHPAAAATTVNVDQGVPFVKALQEKVAPKIVDMKDAAAAAQQSLGTIQRIEDAIKTGKVVTGPTSTTQIYLRQLADVIGVGGKDNEEILKNTRVAIQGMAQLQIGMSRQAEGQGSISNYERELFERASAGADLTNTEIQALMVAMRKVAEFTISAHERNVDLVKGLPKGGEVIAPFLEVPRTTPRRTSAPTGPVKIGSDEEYNKLPSGTTFIGPDGKARTKP